MTCYHLMQIYLGKFGYFSNCFLKKGILKVTCINIFVLSNRTYWIQIHCFILKASWSSVNEKKHNLLNPSYTLNVYVGIILYITQFLHLLFSLTLPFYHFSNHFYSQIIFRKPNFTIHILQFIQPFSYQCRVIFLFSQFYNSTYNECAYHFGLGLNVLIRL